MFFLQKQQTTMIMNGFTCRAFSHRWASASSQTMLLACTWPHANINTHKQRKKVNERTDNPLVCEHKIRAGAMLKWSTIDLVSETSFMIIIQAKALHMSSVAASAAPLSTSGDGVYSQPWWWAMIRPAVQLSPQNRRCCSIYLRAPSKSRAPSAKCNCVMNGHFLGIKWIRYAIYLHYNRCRDFCGSGGLFYVFTFNWIKDICESKPFSFFFFLEKQQGACNNWSLSLENMFPISAPEGRWIRYYRQYTRIISKVNKYRNFLLSKKRF